MAAAALFGAASQSTSVAQEVGVPGTVSEKSQTGSIGPGNLVEAPSVDHSMSAGPAASEPAHRALPPLGAAPPLGPHTTESQVQGSGGPPTVPSVQPIPQRP